jgi:GTP cyclohydrolase I
MSGINGNGHWRKRRQQMQNAVQAPVGPAKAHTRDLAAAEEAAACPLRATPIRSVCEHHMLPVVGVAHVGYLPGERTVGLSKLARVVEMFAQGPQVQSIGARMPTSTLLGSLRKDPRSRGEFLALTGAASR